MRDLLVVFAAVVFISLLGIRFELSERLAAWTRPYEGWQLDELTWTLLAAALGLAWFAYRRWRESQAEIRGRSRTEEKIRQLLAQNRQLARQLLAVQENERRSLARELHDELGQLCNAVKVDAVSLARRGAHELSAIRTSAQAIVAAADRIHEVIRSLLRRLRPPALDDLGLLAALQDQMETWERRHAIACTFVPEGQLDALSEAVNIALYRTVQECLNNIARHAHARHVSVRLTRIPGPRPDAPAGGAEPTAQDRDYVRLRIEDDGRGVDPSVEHQGLGLAGMQERLSALGGTLMFDSALGRGARVDVTVPLEG